MQVFFVNGFVSNCEVAAFASSGVAGFTRVEMRLSGLAAAEFSSTADPESFSNALVGLLLHICIVGYLVLGPMNIETVLPILLGLDSRTNGTVIKV